MFDRSTLPDRPLEFVIVSDTHYMLPKTKVEFESRRRQTERVDHALKRIDDLDPEFLVHLGDLVQEFPGRDRFDAAVDAAIDQLDCVSSPVHHVAGNHDVGDKPDPLMPTDLATSESVSAYHERLGRSWYSWTACGRRFITLNSQIMNSSIEAAEAQRDWFETELNTADEPIVLFVHLPPLLGTEIERGPGHYDVIDEPARKWLRECIRSTSVTDVFAGHTHFEFRTQIGDATLHVLPSVSFSRPGFPELFSASPPAERGRDDRGKLGFYLIRANAEEMECHRILTHGETELTLTDDERQLVPPTADTGTPSRLSVTAIRRLAEHSHVPASFPSSVPEPVRNDYPRIACHQVGVGAIRVSLEGGFERSTPSKLSRDGSTVVTTLFPRNIDLLDRYGTIGDELEFRIAGKLLPDRSTLDLILDIRCNQDLPVSLSAIVPNRSVAGKQHDRLRSGYCTQGIRELDDHLDENGVSVDRVLCQVTGNNKPWETVLRAPCAADLSQIGAVDFLFRSYDSDLETATARLAEVGLAVAARHRSRAYVEPFRSLDRTMDAAHGLLDRRCNTTQLYHVFACLNAALEWSEHNLEPSSKQESGVTVRGVDGDDRCFRLLIPAKEVDSQTVLISLPDDVSEVTEYAVRDSRVVTTKRCSKAAHIEVKVDNLKLIVID